MEYDITLKIRVGEEAWVAETVTERGD